MCCRAGRRANSSSPGWVQAVVETGTAVAVGPRAGCTVHADDGAVSKEHSLSTVH
jgi:hypothetical protein